MRYACEDDAFAEDFVEYSDSWSRAQVRATWTAIGGDEAEARLLECLRPKILALHLTCVDALPITDAGDLTPERTEQMDTRLYTWFAETWTIHLRNLATLGNALRRQLLPISVAVNGMEKEAAAAL